MRSGRSGAYRASLLLAQAHDLKSIAFPAISTGIFGYPLAPATDLAVETVQAFAASESTVQEVVFACFSPEVLAAYRQTGVTA